MVPLLVLLVLVLVVVGDGGGEQPLGAAPRAPEAGDRRRRGCAANVRMPQCTTDVI